MRYPAIEHHGSHDGVTGSCHQVHMDAESSLLIDCGLFQGSETSASGRAGARQSAIEFSHATVQALVITHVHIDHVGRIPYLLAAGFKGPIYCSEPSAKLLPIVLEDAFKLGFSRDQNDIERYLKLVEQRLRPLPYQQWLTLLKTSQLVARIWWPIVIRIVHGEQRAKDAMVERIRVRYADENRKVELRL